MVGMPDRTRARLVDSARTAFVSFAPPDPAASGERATSPTRPPIAVGPGHAATAEPYRDRSEPRGGVTYPIQPGKIQAPNLRDETLARTRLLDWLEIKIHRRVVFVIADAGYGKTTLLADFSRRTRLRTIWYRLDEDDRDWVGFLAHLVAAGRELDPDFAPRTASILRSLEAGGPTREDAIDTFLEEMPSIARDGAALILDDFHLADEVGDIRTIVREIVARGPERLSIVFASRRPPSIPVSKLRTLGELAELGIADLRFSDAEMEQLFRETYGRPLEPDVLAELAKRTEGWAASLALVQAALRERTPAETRSFVRTLSGARDDLHDYLAEEVVGDLPAIQQQFLMRTSILQRVTPELAQVASGLTAVEVQSMIAEAERLGLLGRRAKRRSSEQRYHLLVREFLHERLIASVGNEEVDQAHRRVAAWAETGDWQTAAYHWAAAERWSDVARVLDSHLETIVASGAFAIAAEFYKATERSPASSGHEVILSRQASREGDTERVAVHAALATALDPDNDVVLNNQIMALVLGGEMEDALKLAERLASGARSPLMKEVATAATVLLRLSVDQDVVEAAETFGDLADRSRKRDHGHFEGVSELNGAITLVPAGQFDEALARAQRSIDVLSTTSSGSELRSAYFAKAATLAWLGDLDSARALFREAGAGVRHAARVEYLLESAEVEAHLGDAEASRRLLDAVGDAERHSLSSSKRVATAILSMREGDLSTAQTAIDSVRGLLAPYPGHQARCLAMRAAILVLARDKGAVGACREAIDRADRQRARLWAAVAAVAQSALDESMSSVILTLPEQLRCALSVVAEVVLQSIERLGDAAGEIVRAEATLRRDRWLPAIRRAVANSTGAKRSAAAKLLSQVGLESDIVLLNEVGRSKGATRSERMLGRDLARRLAPQVTVNDLGRITIDVGSRRVNGQELRRKVLALLVFLLTRPRFAATRDEVIEAMWPDIDPNAAINSLNQSVYFLRRVFEPEYSEETSAGYVRQDSDVLWLDTDLIVSTSGRCAALVAEFERTGQPAAISELSEAYREKFALDFAYEEWTSDYRDWLHVSCVRLIESEIRSLLDRGHFERGIAMARRAIQTDPKNDDLEASLLRLLRGSGAHAAAAEQYSHYASMLRRDLGVEAPALGEV
jgi:DNA-binding SARP family transcriptional activator/tetratricopeptide (TPR) repeat protein